jgi:hypothetical protein
MRDLLDYFLRRSIKNWAVFQQPAKSSRSRLLQAAAAGEISVTRDLQEIRFSKRKEQNLHFYYHAFNPFFAYQTANTIAETSLWILRTSSLRMHC